MSQTPTTEQEVIVRPRRLGVEDMLRLASHLTERDRQIAKDCFEFRVLTSSQITRLYFSGTRTATARLEALYRLRVLDRFRPSLPMGSGSAPYHWILDEAGALIVADHLGLDRDELGWQHSVAASIATSQKLRHHVEVNELFTRLSVEASAARGELSEWYGERSCARMSSGAVIPDGYGVLALPGRPKHHVLVELDRASEPSARLRKKAEDYERHLPFSALREFDVTVLLLVPSARRAQTAAAAVAKSAAPIIVATGAASHQARRLRPCSTRWHLIYARPRRRAVEIRRGFCSARKLSRSRPRSERMTRVCLYTRISTDEENQPTSLSSQHERLEAFCKVQEGWRIVARHEARSTGTKLDRPGLQAALDMARHGRVDQLLVYRIDRLSRKVRQLASIAEELDKLDVTLRSATEPFDTGSPAGRMMLQMLGVFAEFEHATIVDRITAGIERRAKEGRWYSGRPPFGYSLSDGQLLPDPIAAPVVGRIFSLYVGERLGTIAIANRLREEHAPAPGAGWGHPAVHRVLTNPTYLGRIRWRGQDFESTHDPLVERETFEQAQAILTERGGDVSRRRGNRSDFLLSGVIRCGRCGRAYIGMSARGKGGLYHYYACTARQKYGPKACSAERLSREKLEDAVFRQLGGIYRDGSLIRDALAAAREQAREEQPSLDERRRSIEAEIARAERSSERYFEAFEQGRLSPSVVINASPGCKCDLTSCANNKTSLPAKPRMTCQSRLRQTSSRSPTGSIGSSPPARPRRPRRCCGY